VRGTGVAGDESPNPRKREGPHAKAGPGVPRGGAGSFDELRIDPEVFFEYAEREKALEAAGLEAAGLRE